MHKEASAVKSYIQKYILNELEYSINLIPIFKSIDMKELF